MVSNPARVVITGWEKRLKIDLDVVCNVGFLAQIDHAQRVVAPVGCFSHWQIVDPADFIEIDELASLANDLKAAFAIESWFEAGPCEYPRVVKSAPRRRWRA